MVSFARSLQHPSRFLDEAPDLIARPVRTMARRPYASTGGLLLLLAGLVGAVAIFPEVHRYLRVRRM
jgi:hypothetical protein